MVSTSAEVTSVQAGTLPIDMLITVSNRAALHRWTDALAECLKDTENLPLGTLCDVKTPFRSGSDCWVVLVRTVVEIG